MMSEKKTKKLFNLKCRGAKKKPERNFYFHSFFFVSFKIESRYTEEHQIQTRKQKCLYIWTLCVCVCVRVCTYGTWILINVLKKRMKEKNWSEKIIHPNWDKDHRRDSNKQTGKNLKRGKKLIMFVLEEKNLDFFY